MGFVDSVPTSSTFDRYLDLKANAIAVRTGGRFEPSVVLGVLLNLASQLWLAHDAKSIREANLAMVYPLTAAASEARELFRLLEEEGIIAFHREPLRAEHSLQIVFDELRDYLLLRYLISNLPDTIRSEADIAKQAKLLCIHFSHENKSDDAFKLLSLYGMTLGEVEGRSDFLRLLQQWDFQTFCACLAHIPPTGKLARCEMESLELFANRLQEWYEYIAATEFRGVLSRLDPWSLVNANDHRDASVAIDLYYSPQCREISYTYRVSDQEEKRVKVAPESRYPIMHLAIKLGDTIIKLHDPEKGLLVSIYRGPCSVPRNLDFSIGPQFPGASLNVPERIALFDVFNEIENLTQNETLFLEPQLSPPDLTAKTSPEPITHANYSDNALEAYLADLMNKALWSYKYVVDRDFPNLSQVLNTYVHFPCTTLIVTDRKLVRYWFVPEDSLTEARIKPRVVSSSEVEVAAPDVKLEVDYMTFEDHVWDDLSRMNKRRPPIHPVQEFTPIESFFGPAPCNDLVKAWLKSDFREVFSF